MWIKICGLTRPDQAAAIANLGVAAVGVIAVPHTPRYVDAEAMAAITQAVVGIPTVGVFLNADETTLRQGVEQGGLTGIQLHGQESVAFCRHLRRDYPDLVLIKAFRPRTEADLVEVAAYAPWVDFVLIDAYHPQMAGGTGHTADWDLLKTWDPPCPWILAGGLNPHTLPLALAQLSPQGVDLSSGVEVAPGLKDLAKVERIMALLAP